MHSNKKDEDGFKKEYVHLLINTIRPALQKLIAAIDSEEYKIDVVDFSDFFDASYKISIKNTKKYFKMVVSGNQVERMINILTEYSAGKGKKEKIIKYQLSEIDAEMVGGIFTNTFNKIIKK